MWGALCCSSWSRRLSSEWQKYPRQEDVNFSPAYNKGPRDQVTRHWEAQQEAVHTSRFAPPSCFFSFVMDVLSGWILRDGIKSFSEILKDSMDWLPLINYLGYLVMKGNRIWRARSLEVVLAVTVTALSFRHFSIPPRIISTTLPVTEMMRLTGL